MEALYSYANDCEVTNLMFPKFKCFTVDPPNYLQFVSLSRQTVFCTILQLDFGWFKAKYKNNNDFTENIKLHSPPFTAFPFI
jgi:hypothetical protein